MNPEETPDRSLPDSEENRKLCEAVLDRMVERGWIARYVRNESGSWGVDWTRTGEAKAALVRRLVNELDLLSDPTWPLVALMLCQKFAPDIALPEPPEH